MLNKVETKQWPLCVILFMAKVILFLWKSPKGKLIWIYEWKMCDSYESRRRLEQRRNLCMGCIDKIHRGQFLIEQQFDFHLLVLVIVRAQKTVFHFFISFKKFCLKIQNTRQTYSLCAYFFHYLTTYICTCASVHKDINNRAFCLTLTIHGAGGFS